MFESHRVGSTGGKKMAVVSVMYPARPGSKFDMSYYLDSHMKMVEETWAPVGLRGYSVMQGVRVPGGGEPAFQVVTNLDFTSAEAFEAAVAGSGAKIMGDIPNFTDTQPAIQISEVAGTYAGGS
jgi:uncharacterized protein (TIGR02118 family)